MRVLVSACLLGVRCRYDAKSVPCQSVESLSGRFDFIPVCAEIMGGLPTPRVPSERNGASVISRDGTDVSMSFVRGAEEVLRLARLLNCNVAILKQNSPSCGSRMIYDGTFSGKLIPGQGVTAELLQKNGITVFSENDISDFLEYVGSPEVLNNESKTETYSSNTWERG